MHACYLYLHDQLRDYEDSELETLLGVKNLHEGRHRDQLHAFFRSCQPFFGKDQCIPLCMMWLNQKLYQSVYDEPTEKLLRSFPAKE